MSVDEALMCSFQVNGPQFFVLGFCLWFGLSLHGSVLCVYLAHMCFFQATIFWFGLGLHGPVLCVYLAHMCFFQATIPGSGARFEIHFDLAWLFGVRFVWKNKCVAHV